MANFKRNEYAFNIIRKGLESTYTSVILLSGPVVTLNAVLNGTTPLDTEGATYYVGNQVLSNLSDLGVVPIASKRYTTDATVKDFVDNLEIKLGFNLSLGTDTLIPSELPATVSQALVCSHSQTSFIGANYSTFMLCSVGTVGSGADLEMSSSTIETNTVLHFSDLKLKF